jgi:hypothetical protein
VISTLRSLYEGSFAFTRPVFPLPGFSQWLGVSLDFTRGVVPSHCCERTHELGNGLDTNHSDSSLLHWSDFLSHVGMVNVG